MNRLVRADNAGRIVGVIDLLRGEAVHAIAGDRENYRAVSFCDGDPLRLIAHYASLGVRSFYVADIDSIQGHDLQSAMISAICQDRSECEIIIDVGWSGGQSDNHSRALAHLAAQYPQTLWVAASESMRCAAALADLAELIGGPRVLLGLDYRHGQLISDTLSEAEWVALAVDRECHGILVLDLAAVGTRRGPLTVETCRRIHQAAPALSILSGGGVRSDQDLRMLLQAGCARCLIGTSLHGD